MNEDFLYIHKLTVTSFLIYYLIRQSSYHHSHFADKPKVRMIK